MRRTVTKITSNQYETLVCKLRMAREIQILRGQFEAEIRRIVGEDDRWGYVSEVVSDLHPDSDVEAEADQLLCDLGINTVDGSAEVTPDYEIGGEG